MSTCESRRIPMCLNLTPSNGARCRVFHMGERRPRPVDSSARRYGVPHGGTLAYTWRVSTLPKPEDMRQAMVDYVHTVHETYLTQAQLQTAAVRGRMPLANGEPFTVIAAGVQNLHVFATREPIAPPVGPEVALEDSLDGMHWTLRFYDPVVLPALGMINEQAGPAGDLVRRALGATTYLYHLIVAPGSGLTGHHAGHAGAGLANSHIAEARDFAAIRAHAPGRESLVDEMEGAALAGLSVAQRLLAAEIVPWLELANDETDDDVRRSLLNALRGDRG